MKITKRYGRTGGRPNTSHLPGLGDTTDMIYVGPPLRRWEQRGLKLGRWFVPLGQWKQVAEQTREQT